MEYKDMHKLFGCHDCRFADKADLGKGPCCNTNYDLDTKTGKCVTREVEVSG